MGSVCLPRIEASVIRPYLGSNSSQPDDVKKKFNKVNLITIHGI